MQNCKGICDSFEYTTKDTRLYYKNDIVYCTTCMIAFPLKRKDGNFCPCCKTRVRRTRSHKIGDKWKLYGTRMIKDKLTFKDLKTLKI